PRQATKMVNPAKIPKMAPVFLSAWYVLLMRSFRNEKEKGKSWGSALYLASMADSNADGLPGLVLMISYPECLFITFHKGLMDSRNDLKWKSFTTPITCRCLLSPLTKVFPNAS